jgi:glucan phosphoethanolaminetransferase (alkaline phosphatase superfamily)
LQNANVPKQGHKKKALEFSKASYKSYLAYFLATVSFLTSVVVVLTAVSFTVESLTEVSTSVVIVEESVTVVSVVSAFFSELHAATDKEIAKAKKPNLNKFFI